MNGLKALVIGLGVVIIAMVMTIAVTLVHRMGARVAPPPAAIAADVMLDEPAGSRMVSLTAAGGRLALLLQGGGADRILFIDPATARVAGRLTLRH